MNRHNVAMARIWLDVAWGGPTATTSLGGMGGVVAGGISWRPNNFEAVTSRGNNGSGE
jgi:hypothetical protein